MNLFINRICKENRNKCEFSTIKTKDLDDKHLIWTQEEHKRKFYSRIVHRSINKKHSFYNKKKTFSLMPEGLTTGPIYRSTSMIL